MATVVRKAASMASSTFELQYKDTEGKKSYTYLRDEEYEDLNTKLKEFVENSTKISAAEVDFKKSELSYMWFF